MQEHEIKELLLQNDKEFKRLFQQHRFYEAKLESYKNRFLPTDEERREAQEFKKRKLALKDRMYVLIAQFKAAQERRRDGA